MNFKPIKLKVNYTDEKYAVSHTQRPMFSWGAEHTLKNAVQSEYRICVEFAGEVLWDSGFVKSDLQTAVYGGSPLPSGAAVKWSLIIRDNFGNISRRAESFFKTALFEPWQGRWIGPDKDYGHKVIYFKKDFVLDKLPQRAVLYHCGIGLDKAYINGVPTNEYRLSPPFTNYAKACSYVTDIINTLSLCVGKNTVNIGVAGGWRKNYGRYLENLSEERQIEFMGEIALNAMLVLYFNDGKQIVVATNTDWDVCDGKIVYAHLFNGERYDDNYPAGKLGKAKLSGLKTKLTPQTIEPVCIKREIVPRRRHVIDGINIYDFGENFSGVVRLKINGICKGSVSFIVRHAEELDENGTLYTKPLRSAEATDVYSAKDGKCSIDYSPEFTYHGFRYASLEICGDYVGEIEVSAFNFYTDIDTDGFFKCSNPLVNAFYKCVIRTERSNLHSIATDCPQRDERMGWLNDATVRFLAMGYNFHIPGLFAKTAEDIKNEQDSAGRITCTAPFVYGERPADPVCTSFLITAMEYYKWTGSIELIERHYEDFCAWDNYLHTRCTTGLVDYTYYGDWAGPEDCCYAVSTIGASETEKSEEYDTQAANSIYLPGIIISSGCHYLNCILLTEFSRLLGKDGSQFQERAKQIQAAYLEKWLNRATGEIYNGSQACQAFSLFIGIIPAEYTKKAAEVMNRAVKDAGYRLQTGNITTPLLLDMLSKYGYNNTAWRLLTRDKYPSWGYMLANGATTLWERFEYKKHSGMNSHNHPMYGAAIRWLYENLAGFRVYIPLKEYVLAPDLPEDLLYFEMQIPLLSGDIYIKCEKKYGAFFVFLDVPFGMKVRLRIKEKELCFGSGYHAVKEV